MIKIKKLIILFLSLFFCTYTVAEELQDLLGDKFNYKINEISKKFVNNISKKFRNNDNIKHLDFSINFQENYKPTIEVESVSKLSEDQDSVLFNQTNLLSHDGDTTINLGLGKRKLLNNENLMLGSNIFLDYQFNESHLRNGFGIEAISRSLDLRGNYYNAISGYKATNSGKEKALDGYDLQLDYHLHNSEDVKTDLFIQTFEWKNPNSSFKEKGEKGGIISQIGNLGFEIGYLNDNKNNDGFFGSIKLVIPLGEINKKNKNQLASKNKDLNLRNKFYIPVKRENRIKVVKLSSGVKVGGF